MVREVKTKIIARILYKSGIRPEASFTKKAIVRILRRILVEEFGYEGLSTIYNYIKFLEMDGFLKYDHSTGLYHFDFSKIEEEEEKET
jgi:hypothetical protein